MAQSIRFAQLDNRAIVEGRRQEALDSVAKSNPAMQTEVINVQDPRDIERLDAQCLSKK
ncbi:hypothetical protein [Caballeronia mineralivorans]|uniref:hypothetical protein n=1 Tax=Caballeronia mineralivorans TaxID=2010198 RepID=UPI000A6570DC|nr:hypothetical protein [Caballeronia mineralivorans]